MGKAKAFSSIWKSAMSHSTSAEEAASKVYDVLPEFGKGSFKLEDISKGGQFEKLGAATNQKDFAAAYKEYGFGDKKQGAAFFEQTKDWNKYEKQSTESINQSLDKGEVQVTGNQTAEEAFEGFKKSAGNEESWIRQDPEFKKAMEARKQGDAQTRHDTLGAPTPKEQGQVESFMQSPGYKQRAAASTAEEDRIRQSLSYKQAQEESQIRNSPEFQKAEKVRDARDEWIKQHTSEEAKVKAGDEEADMRADPKIQQALRDRQHQDNIDSKDTWFGKKKAWVENKIDDLKDHEQPLSSTQRHTAEQLDGVNLGDRTEHVDFMDSKAAHSQRVFDETSNMMEQMKGLKSKEELGEFYKSHGKEGFTGTADEFVKDYHKEHMGKGPSIGDRVQAWHGKQALGVGVIGMGAIKAFDNGGQRSNAQLYGG